MKKNDENNPIQEVGRKGIFSNLHSFEEDYEYEFENEMEEYERQKNTIKETENKNKTKILSREFWVIILTPLIAITILEILISKSTNFVETKYNEIVEEKKNTQESVKENIEAKESGIYDSIYMSKLESMTFTGIGSIPTLYKYDKRIVANWCEYANSDLRFAKNVSTIEINYGAIPEQTINNYVAALERARYINVGNYYECPVYLLERHDGYSLFVVISDYRIIYGCCSGDYTKILRNK